MEALYRRYHLYVYSVCYRYCGSREDALDLTQEVFLRMLRHLDGLAPDRSPKPWIRRIAVNVCLNHRRDRKSPLSLERTTDGVSLLDVLAAPDDPGREVVESMQCERILALIRALPPDEAMALQLRYAEGLAYRDIARAMERPLGTVKSALHRGRRTLRHWMEKEGYETT